MEDIEIVVFNDKSWVRLTEYQKLDEENKQLAKRICELQSDLSRAKSQIEKMKCCHSCKSHKLNDLKNCQTCDDNYSNWEFAE